MGELTDADRWLQSYAAEHGYLARFEPDWMAIFGREFATNPDFLVEREHARAVVESRGFASWAFTDFMDKYRPRGGTIPPGVTRRPIFAALKEKAKQLEPFAATDAPLVVALANTGESDVMLDDHHLETAMFGDLAVSVPVHGPDNTDTELPAPQAIVRPGYGAFCATDQNDAPCNPRPHVSGVAVFQRHDLNADFRRADLRRFLEERAPKTHTQRLQAGEDWLGTAVAKGEGDGPSGSKTELPTTT